MQKALLNVQVSMNTTPPQRIVNIILKPTNLTRIQKLQFEGGIKHFEIDIYDDKVNNEIKQINDDYQQLKAFIKFHSN
jgi:hypothetical protein